MTTLPSLAQGIYCSLWSGAIQSCSKQITLHQKEALLQLRVTDERENNSQNNSIHAFRVIEVYKMPDLYTHERGIPSGVLALTGLQASLGLPCPALFTAITLNS